MCLVDARSPTLSQSNDDKFTGRILTQCERCIWLRCRLDGVAFLVILTHEKVGQFVTANLQEGDHYLPAFQVHFGKC